MLQSSLVPSKPSSAIAGDIFLQNEPSEGGPSDMIKMAKGLLRRRYLTILTLAALTLSASLGYLWITPASYTGAAKILFGNQKAQFLQQQSIMPDAPIDRTQLANQIEELRSRPVAISVIEAFHLADDPDFKPHGLISLASTWMDKARRILGFGNKPGQPKESPPEATIAAFENRLSGIQLGYSNVVEVGFSASSPEKAARIANAVANAFITEQLNRKLSANKAATLWLQKRLRELSEQTTAAEQAVNRFKLKHNIVAIGSTLFTDQQITDLNARLVAARTATSDALVRLNRFNSLFELKTADGKIPTTDPSNADILSSPIINRLRQEYLDNSRKEHDWASRFGKNHLAVVNLRERMKNIRSAIWDEVQRLATSSESDYDSAQSRQDGVEKQLTQALALSRTTGSAEVTLRELEVRAKSLRSLYESLLQRFMASTQQDSFPISDARVIASASPPLGKSKPKSAMVLALGLLGGLGFGVAVGLLKDITEGGFRRPDQVESALQKRCVSIIPLLRTRERPRSRTSGENGSVLEKRIVMRGSGTFWAATTMPLSRFTESIRALKLAVDLDLPEHKSRVIGITSSLPREGKSTLSAALAQLMAHSGARTIVIDCDLRNPSLSHNLTPAARAGVVELALGKKFFEEVIWKDPDTNLTFLPAVNRNTTFSSSSEILSNSNTHALFDWLRENYDYVIVDLPPLGPIVDARVAANLVDRFILAVEWGQTKVDVVQHALRTAPGVGDKIIGIALTKTDMRKIGRYDIYHDDYYSEKHLARYGITG